MDSFIITTAGRRIEMQPVAQRDIERAVAVVDREFKERAEPIDPPWYYSVEPDENGEGGEKFKGERLTWEPQGFNTFGGGKNKGENVPSSDGLWLPPPF